MLQKEYNIRQIPGFVQGFGLFILSERKNCRIDALLLLLTYCVIFRNIRWSKSKQ